MWVVWIVMWELGDAGLETGLEDGSASYGLCCIWIRNV